MRSGKGYAVFIDRSELYRLYVMEQKSLPEIAKQFNCSVSCINKRVNQYKFRRHRKTLDVPIEILTEMSKTMTVKEISDKLDVSFSAIYVKLKRAGVQYKKARKTNKKVVYDDRIFKLREEGKTLQEIADIVGLSVATISRRLS